MNSIEKAPRVAVAMFFTECNQLGGCTLELESFERSGLYAGEELLDRPQPPVLQGMIDTLMSGGATIVPLLKADSVCGGPIASAAYRVLRERLLSSLQASGPLDGVLLALHGAAVTEDEGDPEGDLLAATRRIVGPTVPVIATLDLHAHVTDRMVHHSDALLAWESYPHADSEETGRRAARLMRDVIRGEVVPTMVLAKAPVVVGACYGNTEGPGPFADVMRQTKALEALPGVLTTSAFLVHPYLDLPDLGGGALVVTDNDYAGAEKMATELALEFWRRRFDLEPPTHTPEEAIRLGSAVNGGPVLLVETADCIGGGAAGDSVATLKALLAAGVQERAFVPVVDPIAAAASHRAGEGARVNLKLGHNLAPQWGEPLPVTGTVVRLLDGSFRYDGGLWGGQTVSMGPSAVVEVGSVQILIASLPTYDWADEQYRLAGCDVRRAKWVVVKNPMNYRMAYGPFARATYLLDTPGPTPVSIRRVKHERLKRPFFPADPEIPDFKPAVYRNRSLPERTVTEAGSAARS